MKKKIYLRTLYLRNLYLRKLVKLVFAKPCKTLRNKRKTAKLVFGLAKLVFAKLAKHYLRNYDPSHLPCKQHFYNSTFTVTGGRETIMMSLLRQTHWDVTVCNRRQSPAHYHKKNLDSFLPVPHTVNVFRDSSQHQFDGQGPCINLMGNT